MTNTNITHEVTVQEGYRRWATQYDQENNALIVLEEQLTLPLLATIPITHVLDLGTGTGRYAIRLAAQGAHVIALDQSEAMLSVAQQAADQAGVQVRFLLHRLEMDIPGESDSFDLLLAALLFCHVESLAHMAHEAYRVLRPGGHILVTDFHPAAIAAGWRTEFTNDEGRFLLPTAQHTRDHYLTMLDNAGFRIQTVLDGLVRDAPTNAFPADIIAKDGDLPFCLVILASKPINDVGE
jgi:ubiquinone/menaquinone biosynthesis C-methylase UbiE